MLKTAGTLAFGAILGVTLLATGLFAYLEIGNLLYEEKKCGAGSVGDIVQKHFDKAAKGWKY